jgi:predicted amidohydrolase YtcJ
VCVALQVTLLAEGRLMYHGKRSGVSAWFASLGFARLHGEESDWLLDLVATGFDKPQQLFGNKLMDSEDVAAAANAFRANYMKVRQHATGDLPISVAWRRCNQPLERVPLLVLLSHSSAASSAERTLLAWAGYSYPNAALPTDHHIAYTGQ